MDKAVRVGWIGLGNMGRPMSRRILEAGLPITVYNRTKEKTVDIVQLGARVADSPAHLAQQAEIIFTTVADSNALESVATGENGVIMGAREGSILIDMSTVSPNVSTKVGQLMKEKGINFLRAPVAGSTGMAATGSLKILVSGNEETYEKCRSLLMLLGERIFYLGSGAEALFMKLALNVMVGICCQMLSEGLIFGERAGLDVNQMLEVINNTSVASPLIAYKSELFAQRNFVPGFTTTLMEKDFDLALTLAKGMKVPLVLTSIVRQLLTSSIAKGNGELDFSCLFSLAEDMAGITH